VTRKKKLGGLGKLSQFSGIKSQEEIEELDAAKPLPETQPKNKQDSSASSVKPKEKMVNVNIKIPSSNREWLANTAQKVRNNNPEPVAVGNRIYPQHLIGVAIELLRDIDVDWGQIKNMEDLREYLKAYKRDSNKR